MLNIENARPSAKQLLINIEEFEQFCLGAKKFKPSKFREINEELSIGAVLMLGKRRFLRHDKGRKIIWCGLDNQEHDLGYMHDAKVMRDYPGFHASRSLSLGSDMVLETKIIPSLCNKSNVTSVTMSDGSTGIGPNYRIALRNAALKKHFKEQFNSLSLSNIWQRVWGNA